MRAKRVEWSTLSEPISGISCQKNARNTIVKIKVDYTTNEITLKCATTVSQYRNYTMKWLTFHGRNTHEQTQYQNVEPIQSRKRTQTEQKAHKSNYLLFRCVRKRKCVRFEYLLQGSSDNIEQGAGERCEITKGTQRVRKYDECTIEIRYSTATTTTTAARTKLNTKSRRGTFCSCHRLTFYSLPF